VRIAHLANMYGPQSGGLRTTVDQLAAQYSESGHELLIITPYDRDSRAIAGNVTRIQVASPRLPLSGGYRIILSLRKVRQTLQNFNPDVIEISDRSTLVLLAPWARRRGIKVALFAHERLKEAMVSVLPLILRDSHLLAGIIWRWNQWTAANVDIVIATTKFASLEFSKVKHKEVIPLGVNHSHFNPNQGCDHEEVLPSERFIMACTRLSPEKDPLLILEVAREISRRSLRLPVMIIGSGPMLETLKDVASREELDIAFVGFVGDKALLASYMRKASVFLAPGPIETFGLAALEAMACGTPVICREGAAIAEIIDEGSGVALRRDAIAWVDEIERFLASDALRVSRACVARASSFSWSATASSLLQCYAGLLGDQDRMFSRTRLR
jgi:alpha-1,6-mannosyltransferase